MRLIPAEHSDESALVSEIIDKTCHISQNYALNKLFYSFYDMLLQTRKLLT